jgi:hypothetical protein
VLDVPSQQLFSTLKDYGWIRKLDDGWALSTKGEVEGGEYVHSKRYGRYIIWPEEIAQHPLLQALEDNRHISATSLGKSAGVSTREVNRVLAELGWIKPGFHCWELTASGEHHGGVQLENDSSGTFYVVWPQDIAQHSVLSRELGVSFDIYKEQQQTDDLFTDQAPYSSVDGHQHSKLSHLKICHWLYMAGFVHACHRRLPVEEPLFADFYLPAQHVYIECWDDEEGVGLSQRMQRKELYQVLGASVIDIEKDDLNHLDEVLTRQFRKQGIRVY